MEHLATKEIIEEMPEFIGNLTTRQDQDYRVTDLDFGIGDGYRECRVDYEMGVVCKQDACFVGILSYHVELSGC